MRKPISNRDNHSDRIMRRVGARSDSTNRTQNQHLTSVGACSASTTRTKIPVIERSRNVGFFCKKGRFQYFGASAIAWLVHFGSAQWPEYRTTATVRSTKHKLVSYGQKSIKIESNYSNRIFWVDLLLFVLFLAKRLMLRLRSATEPKGNFILIMPVIER